MPAAALAPAPAASATAAPLPARAGLGLRVLRAVPFATVCVVLSAAGHVFASGGALPLPALLLGWLAICAMATAAAGRERSLRALCVGLLGAQAALHLLFQLAQPAAPGTPAMPGMAGMAAMPGMAPPEPSHAHAALLGMSAQMLAAHLLAALAAGWWLRRGEAAIWRLVRMTAKAADAAARACTAAVGSALLLAAARPGALAAPAARRLPAGWDDDGAHRLPTPLLLRHSVIRRGPPAGAYH
ncbi:hypothetical protein P3T37_005021 [Kitasatospora sp. MAA4]|uniref:hypothetical protein n=1 Tax=Kitasatospora sp. MAA4 TaxID=3035093 RepID=UPI0024764683|nr:hypothetical protein [Kitasatospora sp. MAA4]MDH6135605.1 hypothetical protein [Kitasatospora sp. MAA4]